MARQGSDISTQHIAEQLFTATPLAASQPLAPALRFCHAVFETKLKTKSQRE
jgi:hypothetical protein